MNKESALHFGDNRNFLVSEKGEIRSGEPFFLSTLAQLQILILKAGGFTNNEIGPILLIAEGRVRNSTSNLYRQNENSYNGIMNSAMELSLLNTVAVRGIITLLKNDKEKKINTSIVESMENAIKEKREIGNYYPSSLEKLRRITSNRPIPILVPAKKPVILSVA